MNDIPDQLAAAFVDAAISTPPRRDRSGRMVSLPENGGVAMPLAFISFADVQPSLDANDFVEGVLTTGAMSVLYGESNCGKTFLALDLALHVAQGKTWFGREVTQGPVLYLALEGGSGIRNRIAAYRAVHNLEDATIAFAIVPQSLDLLDPEGDLAAIIATAKAMHAKFEAAPILIVIDTLSRSMPGGNENAPEDMTALVAVGDELRKATGAHCLWVHHTGKDTAKGARGHSSLRAATDTEIEVIADKANRRAEVRKQRDLAGGDVFCFTLQPYDLGHNQRGKPVTSCTVQPADDEADGTSGVGDASRKLTGQPKRAFEVLSNIIAAEGQSGFSGTPAGLLSVPDQRWREEFYGAAMPGATPEARKKAFRRAADLLVDCRCVAASGGRVWIVSRNETGRDNGT